MPWIAAREMRICTSSLTLGAYRPSPKSVRLMVVVASKPAAVESDGSSAPMLPAACYTSTEFFEFEREAVFARSWICAGRAEQIPNAGDYLALNVAGEPLLVVGTYLVGAAAGAGLAFAFGAWPQSPETAFALIATSAVCAGICRTGLELEP